MLIVADENVDRSIVLALRSDGHEVVYILELSPSITDIEVLDIANNKNAVLLTGDKDFGELVFRQRRIAVGVILIRLLGLETNKKAEIVSKIIKDIGESIYGAFVVVTPKSIRIRNLKAQN